MRKLLLAFIFLSISLAAQVGPPERKVADHAIISEHDPRVRIDFPPTVKYTAADRFVLYDMADCELHAFVEADAKKNVQRLYWVQFEGYLPSKPDLHHTYDSPRHTTIGGWDFFVDTWVRAADEPVRPGSDREHIQALVSARGYKWPAGMILVRLVHLLDEAKRKELMIIYGEDVAGTGFSAGELKEGGKAHDQWPGIEKGLVERAEKAVKIEELVQR